MSIVILNDIFKEAEDWIPISDLQKRCADYFSSIRSKEEIEKYRIGKGIFKKFRDEIIPAVHFTKATKLDGLIKFSLSNEPPDCVIRELKNPDILMNIEITRALATSQYWLLNELNNQGHAPGFIAIPDKSENDQFRTALSAPRETYSTKDALNAVLEGVKKCIDDKNKKNYTSCQLLIEAPIGQEWLPRTLWAAIIPSLRSEAKNTQFTKVHLIGNEGENTLYYRLK